MAFVTSEYILIDHKLLIDNGSIPPLNNTVLVGEIIKEIDSGGGEGGNPETSLPMQYWSEF